MSSIPNPILSPDAQTGSAARGPSLVDNAVPRSNVAKGRIAALIQEYWSAGIVTGLVLLDGLVVALCLADLLRFLATGLSLGDSLTLAWEGASVESASVREGLIVFGIFLFVLPALMAMLVAVLRRAALRPAAERSESPPDAATSYQPAAQQASLAPRASSRHLWLRILLYKGSFLVPLHILLSIVVLLFTVLAQSMQTLAGSQWNEVLQPAFPSFWLLVVSGMKMIYPGYFLPVFRKFFVRMAGREHTSFWEVLKEIFTEEGLRGK